MRYVRFARPFNWQSPVSYYLSTIILFLAFIPPITAETFGQEHPVQIITKNESNGMEILVKNSSIASYTVTLYFTKLQNAKASRKLPATIVVPSQKTLSLLSIHQINKNKKWDSYFMYNYMIGSMRAKHEQTVIYQLPYHKGKSYRINQGYNGKLTLKGEHRYSLEWGMPVGTEVLAARGGLVVDIKDHFDGNGFTQYYWNRNNYVLIEYDDGTIGSYMHFKKIA